MSELYSGNRLIDAFCSCDRVEVANEVWDIVIIFILLAASGSTSEGFRKVLVLSGTNLLQDLGKQGLERLGLWVSRDNKEVLTHRELGCSVSFNLGLTVWLLEVNDGVVILEHVDLVNIGKWLHA